MEPAIKMTYTIRIMMRPIFDRMQGTKNLARQRSVADDLSAVLIATSAASHSAFALVSYFTESSTSLYSFYFGVVQKPPQQMIVVSLQQQAPQHSPHFFSTRLVSQTTTQRKMVITMKYSMTMVTLANRQKDLRASRLLRAPKEKARAFVTEVIVMAGPAWLIASWILM